MTQPSPDLESYLPRFGLASFRQGQREVIATILARQDCLCVMPTGGGKSLCYQLPALALDGLTLVVSPLIALMKDQVDQLQALGLPVSFINSTLSMAEQNDRLDRMAAGQYRLMYVVPERFRSGRFLEAVGAARLSLLAVDEAHCISEWGHDFRPDYARLGLFRRRLGNPTTIALTATATDRVRRDIVEQLALREPRTFITGFARPNLFYEVQSPRREGDKAEMLVRFLRETPGSGIVYASTRKRTEEVAAIIAQQTQRRATVYHAGLMADQRREAQDAFMSGRYEIVAATNAFGMGIDKADVRFVVHYNLPGSLEAYYQEAGRAGRDGLPSRCLMLYHGSDRYIQEYFIENGYPGREFVQQVHELLCGLDDDPIQLTQKDVKERLGLSLSPEGVGNCEQILEKAGALERLLANQNMASVRLDSDLPTLVDLLPKQAKVQRRVLQAVERLVGSRRNELVYFHPRELEAALEFDSASITRALHELSDLASFTYVPPFRGRALRILERNLPFEQLDIDFAALELRKAEEYEKLNRVVRFALSGACRQQEILRYFAEGDPPRCGHCDNCAAQHVKPHAAPAQDQPLDEGVTETFRIVLSGVARTEARIPCGKNLIAQMLCGSQSAKVAKLRLNKLSTFGLLAALRQPEVVTLIDALIAAGCLEQEDLDRFRPVVRLTPLGGDVMREKTELPHTIRLPNDLAWKLRRHKAKTPAASPRPAPTEGWSGDGPAARASVVPTGDESGPRGEAAGAGQADALDTLPPSAFRPPPSSAIPGPQSPIPNPAPSSEVALPPPIQNPKSEIQNPCEAASGQPPHYWTWRLLAAGFSMAECMAIRGLSREVVLDHAIRAAESGWTVRAEWCLPPDRLAAIASLVGHAHAQPIRPLLAQLPPGTLHEEVQFYLKCRAPSKDSPP